MSDVADRVRKIVVEHLGVEEDKVVEGASFIDDLGADSLDTVELVMAFEEEFGIESPDDAAETIRSVCWRILAPPNPLARIRGGRLRCHCTGRFPAYSLPLFCRLCRGSRWCLRSLIWFWRALWRGGVSGDLRPAAGMTHWRDSYGFLAGSPCAPALWR